MVEHIPFMDHRVVVKELAQRCAKIWIFPTANASQLQSSMNSIPNKEFEPHEITSSYPSLRSLPE